MKLLIYTTLFASFVCPILPSQDPPVPPERFKVQTKLDQVITWSDGYKSTLDIYYPQAKAPKTGWPCVLIVHGKSGSRKISENRKQANYFTSFGYACIAYDVRGDGTTRKLNPPGKDTSNPAKFRDMAEVFGIAAALVPGKIDQGRLAVTGRSMGGSHSYRAAAYSGKPMPVPGPIKTFPTIKAVAGDWQILDKLEDNFPGGGSLIRAQFVQGLYLDRNNKPSLWNLVKAGNYAQARNLLAKDPDFNFLPLLSKSQVPLLCLLGYRDVKHVMYTLTQPLASLKGRTTRLYLSTRGHGLPNSNTEFILHLDMKRRFWDRFLKGIKNGVEREPFAEIGIIPSDPKAYANSMTDWEHVQFQQWPPSLPSSTFYLGTNRDLRKKAPGGSGFSPLIQNLVKAGYTIEQFAQQIKLPSVLSNIPASQIRYRSLPLPSPRTLLGRGSFSGDAWTSAGRVQVSALLYDLPPTGKPVFVTTGTTGLGQVSAGKHRLTIQLDDVAYTFQKGHRIGLVLQNLAIRETVPGKPGDPYISLSPEFNNFSVKLAVGGSFPARLDLPLTTPPNTMLPRISDVSFGSQLSYPFKIKTQHPGGISYILMGGSGSGPGLNIPPYLPLNPDPWTSVGISLIGTPYLQGFLSVLDAKGEASMRFQVPAAYRKDVMGQRFTFAPLIFDKGLLFSGNPSVLSIRP